MRDKLAYFLEVDRLIREEGMEYLKACEEAPKRIKKTAQGSQNKLNSTITDIEINYNLDNGQIFDEKSGESVDTTVEDACKYIFKGWSHGKV